MLSKPSARRQRSKKEIELNLVPMMDTFVVLIGFLLYTMAFLSLVSVEAPLPTASPTEVVKKLKEKPLQLTVSFRTNETEVWSPFQKIKSTKIPHTSEGAPDLMVLHETLIGIKQQFPNEKQIVLAPTGSINYEILVAAMDSIRLLDATDPPIFAKNQETGSDEVIQSLFPEIVFGNILGTD